jgi:tryptophan synthase alpha chain
MKTIESLFRDLAATGKKAFIPYITAGDPDVAATVDVLRLLQSLGADMVEVGVPFSDPMADGPVIQAAMERSLRNGTTLRKHPGDGGEVQKAFVSARHSHGIFQSLSCPRHRKVRPGCEGRRGERGAHRGPAARRGRRLFGAPRDKAIASIFLATPLTDRKRMAILKKMARAFIYLVSVTGVTGEREGLPEELTAKAKELKDGTGLPVVLGFGISGPRMVRQYHDSVDGFVVGSAIVKRWEEAVRNPSKQAELKAFVAGMARECHKAMGREGI